MKVSSKKFYFALAIYTHTCGNTHLDLIVPTMKTTYKLQVFLHNQPETLWKYTIFET